MASPPDQHTVESPYPSTNRDESEPQSRSISVASDAPGTVANSERSSSSLSADGSSHLDESTSATVMVASQLIPMLPSGSSSLSADAQGSLPINGTSASLSAASSLIDPSIGAPAPIATVQASEGESHSSPPTSVSQAPASDRRVAIPPSVAPASLSAAGVTDARNPGALAPGSDALTSTGACPGLQITESSSIADIRSISIEALMALPPSQQGLVVRLLQSSISETAQAGAPMLSPLQSPAAAPDAAAGSEAVPKDPPAGPTIDAPWGTSKAANAGDTAEPTKELADAIATRFVQTKEMRADGSGAGGCVDGGRRQDSVLANSPPSVPRENTDAPAFAFPVYPSRLATSAPLVASHTRTVLSSLADARRAPSGLHATLVSQPKCSTHSSGSHVVRNERGRIIYSKQGRHATLQIVHSQNIGTSSLTSADTTLTGEGAPGAPVHTPPTGTAPR